MKYASYNYTDSTIIFELACLLQWNRHNGFVDANKRQLKPLL